MGIVRRAGIIRFRHNAALTVAAVVALVGALPVAASSPWLAPIPLVPLAVAVWAWRAGTDADRHGLQVRALLGSRRLPWARIAQLVPTGHGRVSAVLTDGAVVTLTAVTPADLPRLVAASGQELTAAEEADSPDPAR
ncbi:MAG: PH domain-containing protein [Micromonosporaceae bacterium]